MGYVEPPPPYHAGSGRSIRDVQGMFGDTRKRVAPGLFTDIDREYRAKFLKASQLSARDQSYHLFHMWDNPDFRKVMLNPLRRLWNVPGEAFEKALRPAMGLKNAFVTRWLGGRMLFGLVATWYLSYYALYVGEDWKVAGGWKVLRAKPMTGPNNPNFPKPDPKYERTAPGDYFSQDFNVDPQAVGLKPSTPTTW